MMTVMAAVTEGLAMLARSEKAWGKHQGGQKPAAAAGMLDEDRYLPFSPSPSSSHSHPHSPIPNPKNLTLRITTAARAQAQPDIIALLQHSGTLAAPHCIRTTVLHISTCHTCGAVSMCTDIHGTPVLYCVLAFMVHQC